MSALPNTPENVIPFPAKTREDVEILTAPFAAAEHEFLKGMVYLREEAITSRLDMVDPSWQFTIMSVTTRPGTPVPVVTVVGNLTIKGVTQSGVGMAKVELTKSGDGEAGEAEKAAATDALKRAARLHGVGRYLLSMPRKMDPNSISEVLWTMYPSGNPLNKYIASPGETDPKPPEKPATPKARPQTTDGSSALKEQPESLPTLQPFHDPSARIVYAAGVEVKETAGGKMLSFEIDADLEGKQKRPSAFTRQAFINAGHCQPDGWTATGFTTGFAFPIPIAIKQNDKGFWNVIAAADKNGNWHDDTPEPTDPTPPPRTPAQALGKNGNKGPIGRDEITIDNIGDVPPADLPPTGTLPTPFSQKSQDILEHRTAIASAVEKYKGAGGHEYVRFVHPNGTDLSMTVNQFSKAIAGHKHASDYIDIVVATEEGLTSKPWADDELPDLSIKFEMDGDKAKIINIAELDDIPF